ncbi:MAG: MoxR family ATPase [Acidobacteria bacterium]|nr:MoxR family ATPase [Acidobacteriota bacterium]MBI3656304.1 MoxR family ATPase [Acidobacteriota bacterium]
MPNQEAASGHKNDAELVDKFKESRVRVMQELRKVIVGQDDVIEQVLISLFVGGHAIVTGVPGLAKTLLIQTLGDTLTLQSRRIQFTPDLMPSDITGTDIIEEDKTTGRREMVFMPGPIFTNILLADEINRTTPKTQSALLEAMQESRVTVQGKTYPIEPPFFVLATQNPIELEGTYPLPEAQLDRFLFNIVIDYLSEDEELEVVGRTTSPQNLQLTRVLDGREILAFQSLVRRVPVGEPVARFAIQLVRSTRPSKNGDGRLPFIQDWVSWGASVRASQNLILGGKVRALLRGRYNVAFEDIEALAAPVLRHRILLNFHAESEKVTTDDIVKKLLSAVPKPKSGL